jgi:hypothetical protein
LLSHGQKLWRLEPHTLETRQLQFRTEERRELVNPHTSETQRLIGWLKKVFPQSLHWFDNPGCGLVRALLLRWPTLLALQPKTRHTFFHQHTCRSEERIAERLAQIRRAVRPALLARSEGLLRTTLSASLVCTYAFHRQPRRRSVEIVCRLSFNRRSEKRTKAAIRPPSGVDMP